MKIKDVLKFFDINSNNEEEVDNIVLNSKLVNEGSIFIALKGKFNCGLDYLEEAKCKGAKLIISDTDSPYAIVIRNIKKRLTEFCMFFYNYPNKKLTLIGVTGTNGKSTTAYLINQQLNLLGKKSILLTTTRDINNSIVAENTTPYGDELARAFLKAIRKKAMYFVMEISSIGIINDKLNGLDFKYIVAKKITKDHIEEHGSIKKYRNSKINFLKQQKNAILVLPSFIYKQMKLRGKNTTFYHYHIRNKDMTLEATNFIFDNRSFKTNLIGDFNIDNIIATYSLLKTMKFNEQIIVTNFNSIKPLKGRMELILKKPVIIIDYAHNSVAFKRCLKFINKHKNGRKLVCIFGAGGERDVKKRKKYGDIAYKFADKIVVTEDNSRSESPIKIIEDIVHKRTKKFIKIVDRKEAIWKTLSALDEQSILVIIGKGYEKNIKKNGQLIAHCDEEEVNKWVKASRSL